MIILPKKLLTCTEYDYMMMSGPVTNFVHRKEVVKVNLVKDNVRAIRLAKGIMATHVGRALGYTSAAGYYHLEKGASSLGVEELKVIANVLGEPVGVFFDQESTESVIQRIRSGEIARNGRNRPGQDEAPVQATHKDS